MQNSPVRQDSAYRSSIIITIKRTVYKVCNLKVTPFTDIPKTFLPRTIASEVPGALGEAYFSKVCERRKRDPRGPD